MYKVEIDQEKSEARISLDGELTVRSALKIRDEFSKLIAQADTLVLDHTNSEEYDLAYFQLLTAFMKSTQEAGKKIEIHPDGSGKFIETAALLGFPDLQSINNSIADSNTAEGKNA